MRAGTRSPYSRAEAATNARRSRRNSGREPTKKWPLGPGGKWGAMPPISLVRCTHGRVECQREVMTALRHRADVVRDGRPGLAFVVAEEDVAVGRTREESGAAGPHVHAHRFD